MKLPGLSKIVIAATVLLGFAGSSYAEDSWMGVEFGVLNIDSEFPPSGGRSKSGSTPVLRFSGEVCSALFGTEGDMVQVFSADSSASKPDAVSVFGLECSVPVWEQAFAPVDVSVGAGIRYRYHSHFKSIHDTFVSLPLSVTFSKQVIAGLVPYATLGFGPIGYVTGDKYGKYNAIEAGLNYQFSEKWKASFAYNMANDESLDKGTTNGHSSSMTTVGIHVYW